ncbi:MAG: biotin/lipoyl-containing protein [Bacteroidota bacterium]
MKSQDFKVIVNDELEFTQLDVNDLDIVSLKENNAFHILKDGKSYHAKVVKTDFANKKCTLKVNGRLYQLSFRDTVDQMITRLGLAISSDDHIKDVKAPMPGLVLEISVEAGQEVEKGTPLLILEAMKMENVIKSPGVGVVKKVLVEKGDAVEKNAVLIEME